LKASLMHCRYHSTRYSNTVGLDAGRLSHS
jgi:hypothetical protein